MRLLPFALIVSLAAAVPAEAQIFTWRDASGTLVVSNRARPDGATPVATYAVPGAESVRTTTRPAAGRAAQFDNLIRLYAAEHGVSPDLVRAVIQAESAFNPRAVSPKGAMGLMQLMPATARELGVRDPFQPADNIRGGVTYLARLLQRYRQNVELALAAYNAGPANVERYGRVPPFRETQAYVKKIQASRGASASSNQAAAPGSPGSAPSRAVVIYKWTAMVAGQPTVRYSNVPPADLPYEVVGSR